MIFFPGYSHPCVKKNKVNDNNNNSLINLTLCVCKSGKCGFTGCDGEVCVEPGRGHGGDR